MGWRERWVWGQLEGGLPTTLVMLGTGVTSRTLVLLLTPQKQPSGGGLFWYLVAHNLPQLHMPVVVFSSLSFLCILFLKEMFAQVQVLQQRVPGLAHLTTSPSTPQLRP